MWVGDIQSLGGLSWIKRQKKVRLLSACAETSIFSYPGHRPSWFSGFWTQPGVYTTGPWFSGLHTRAEFYHQLSWFSSFQTAHHRTSQPPYPITMHVNSYNKCISVSLYLYLYMYISVEIQIYRHILLVLFLWKILTKTHPDPLLWFPCGQGHLSFTGDCTILHGSWRWGGIYFISVSWMAVYSPRSHTRSQNSPSLQQI